MKRKIRSTRSQRGLAPVLRLKTKKRPRGKPFPKGNAYGLTSRFVKGQSGNPGGKPRTKEVSHASREWLAQPTTLPELLANKLPRELEGWTHAAVLAWIRGQGALGGSLADAVELVDRAEGKPHTSIAIGSDPDPLAKLVEEVHAISQQIGPPVGDDDVEEGTEQ